MKKNNSAIQAEMQFGCYYTGCWFRHKLCVNKTGQFGCLKRLTFLHFWGMRGNRNNCPSDGLSDIWDDIKACFSSFLQVFEHKSRKFYGCQKAFLKIQSYLKKCKVVLLIIKPYYCNVKFVSSVCCQLCRFWTVRHPQTFLYRRTQTAYRRTQTQTAFQAGV